MSGNSKFFFKAVPGERIETVLTLPEEERSTIWGAIQTADETPVPDALVLLCDAQSQEPIAQTFTDETGHFFFGPLEPEHLYCIRVFHHSVHVRTLEITI